MFFVWKTQNSIKKIETETKMSFKVAIPPYGQREHWVPRRAEVIFFILFWIFFRRNTFECVFFFWKDFGDSGAFPEIHVVQYPLDMGKTKAKTSNALALQLDSQGDVKFDLIAKQGSNKNKIVHSKFTDLLPKQVTEDDPDLIRPDPDAVKEVNDLFFSI